MNAYDRAKTRSEAFGEAAVAVSALLNSIPGQNEAIDAAFEAIQELRHNAIDEMYDAIEVAS